MVPGAKLEEIDTGSKHASFSLHTTTVCRMVVLGGIKTGSKKLFIRVETGSFQEIEPTCVLDFFVHEDYQRQGIGKLLFEVRQPYINIFKPCLSCLPI